MRKDEPEPRAATFDECYAEHRDKVYRLCLRYSSGRGAFAEDVTQETFMQLYRNFADVDQEKPVSEWLYAVASRLCISRLRKDRSFFGWVSRLVNEGNEVEPSAPSAAEIFEHHEEAAAVMKDIAQLPPNERVALCMKAIDGKSQRDIARILQVSEGYVSRLITSARKRLSAMGWENIE